MRAESIVLANLPRTPEPRVINAPAVRVTADALTSTRGMRATPPARRATREAPPN